MSLIPRGSTGVPIGTAHVGAEARFARKPPSGCDRRIVSVCPRTLTPARRDVLPLLYAANPEMSEKAGATYDLVRGFVILSIATLNVAAVTGAFDGGENRKPRRILNVYVVPPCEGTGIASATSGTMRDPSGAGLSGYVSKLAHVG